MMLVAFVMALVFASYLLWQSDIIIPGVQVFGMELGGRSKEDAVAILSSYWADQSITLDAGPDTWTVPPETIGIMFDAEATAELAYRQGRSFDSLGNLLRTWGRIHVPPAWIFDEALAQEKLADFEPLLEVQSQNASIEIVDGQVVTRPPVGGRRLDLEATLLELTRNPAQVYMSRRLPMVTTMVSPEIDDISAIARDVERLLSTTITIRAFDPVNDQAFAWTVPPAVWGDWLSLEINSVAGAEYQWKLDSDGARTFLDMQAELLGTDRYLDLESAVELITDAINKQEPIVNFRIYHHPRQHVVQSGETLASIGRAYGIPFPWIQEANPGIGDQLSVGQVIIVPSPDELLPLPVVEGKRLVVSISQQKMWAYENGTLKWEWTASTGISTSPTSPGVFQIQSHEINAYAGNWDLWMPYFMGIYRPVPTSDFMNGFHGFPTRDGANLLWTGNLGHQVTYGCILISTVNAMQLFEWAENGVIVEVRS